MTSRKHEERPKRRDRNLVLEMLRGKSIKGAAKVERLSFSDYQLSCYTYVHEIVFGISVYFSDTSTKEIILNSHNLLRPKLRKKMPANEQIHVSRSLPNVPEL